MKQIDANNVKQTLEVLSELDFHMMKHLSSLLIFFFSKYFQSISEVVK